MATDKSFYKLAINYPAAILKPLGIADSENYKASSFTFKDTENRRDLIFEKSSGKDVVSAVKSYIATNRSFDTGLERADKKRRANIHGWA